MAYFEIFYAWARVHMHSVFGNFIKEVGLRLFSLIALLGVYYKWITVVEFIYLTAGIYFVGIFGNDVLCISILKNRFFNLLYLHNVKEILDLYILYYFIGQCC